MLKTTATIVWEKARVHLMFSAFVRLRVQLHSQLELSCLRTLCCTVLWMVYCTLMPFNVWVRCKITLIWTRADQKFLHIYMRTPTHKSETYLNTISEAVTIATVWRWNVIHSCSYHVHATRRQGSSKIRNTAKITSCIQTVCTVSNRILSLSIFL